MLDRPGKPGDDERRGLGSTADIILAAGFARGLRLLSRPRMKRAQGKPDASRIRWPRTKTVERYELTSPQERRHPAFPARRTCGLCRSLPGDRYAHRRLVNALRLVIRFGCLRLHLT